MAWLKGKRKSIQDNTSVNAQDGNDSASSVSKTITEEVYSLNKNVLSIVEKSRSEINEDGMNNEDIKNLLNYDLFNVSNWDPTSPTSLPRLLNDELGSIEYKTTIFHPLSEQFETKRGDDSTFIEIYDEIVDSFIQEKTSIYKDTVVSGIASQYERISKENDDILEYNNERLQLRYDSIGNKAINRVDNIGGTGSAPTGVSINDIICEMKNDLEGKKDIRKKQISDLENRITLCRNTVTGEPVVGDPEPLLFEDVLSVLSASFKMLLQILLAPFKYLGRGLSKFGTQFQRFSKFAGDIAERPAFWIAIPFTAFNAVFFYQIFNYMFSDVSNLIVYIFIVMYMVAFIILPFAASGHLRECIKNGLSKNVETALMLVFETGIIIAAAISYPLMAIRFWRTDLIEQENYTEYPYENNYELYNTYYEAEQVGVSLMEMRSIAAIVIGIAPLLMAICLMFMNYRNLKNKTP